MEPSNYSEAIVEEGRPEFIISPSNGKITLRKANFLIPTAINYAQVFAPPHLATPILPSTIEKPFFTVVFNGWEYPSDEWCQWVQSMSMSQQCQQTWNIVGIRDAIMNSKYKICRSENLIFRLAERWCPETNTFVFPWGEVTITLEDVMLMAGYPVLGYSPSSAHENEDMIDIYEELAQVRKEIANSKSRKPSQKRWMDRFMGSGSQIEHLAFLVYWLSRFVFPSSASGSIIRIEVFSVAIRLARGIKVALGPAILANIYHDLSLLKEKIHNQSQGEKIRLSAPLQLVQVWAWERFIGIQPIIRNSIGPLEPRMALWNGMMMRSDTQHILSTFAFPREGFLWRPYTTGRNFPSHEFFRDRDEVWILTGADDLDERVESIARFMRVCELPSLEGNYKEVYYPHRVAMQFGIDQDLPGFVGPTNTTIDIAWRKYSRLPGGRIMYVPAGDYRSGITTRYAKWWKELNSLRA